MVDGIVNGRLTEARDRILKSRHVVLCLKRLHLRHAVSNCSILSHMSPNSHSGLCRDVMYTMSASMLSNVSHMAGDQLKLL
jgi:hypothetical protein